MKLSDSCYFCGSPLSRDDHDTNLTIRFTKDEKMSVINEVDGITWASSCRETGVHIPRCQACKNTHDRNRKHAGRLGSLLFAIPILGSLLVGMVLAILFLWVDPEFDDFLGATLVLSFIPGAFFGCLIRWIMKKPIERRCKAGLALNARGLISLNGVGLISEYRKHPDVKQMLAMGWHAPEDSDYLSGDYLTP
jgi:hypothetical protein